MCFASNISEPEFTYGVFGFIKAQLMDTNIVSQPNMYTLAIQEHELKTLSDHMCDLNSLKESVKEHTEEIIIIKEDYTRMKTHLNVSAKLELQVKNTLHS